MESSSKLIVKNTFWIFFGKIIVQLISLTVNILIIRKIPVSVFGTFNTLLIFGVVTQILTIGPINQVINRYVPEFETKKQYRKIVKLLLYSFLYIFSLLIIIVLAGVIFKKELFQFVGITDSSVFEGILVIYIILICFLSFLQAVITSLLLHKKIAHINIITIIIRSLLIIYFLNRIDIYYLLLIESIMTLIHILLVSNQVVIFLKKTNLKNVEIPEDQKISKKRIFRYGSLSFFNELGAGIINRASDYFIISAMANQYQVGLYAFAFKINDILFRIIPFNELMSLLRPVYIKKFTSNYNKDEFIRIYNFIVKLILPVCLFPTLYFLLFGKQIIAFVFDPKYINAYVVTTVVLFDNVISAFFYPLGLSMQLKEKMLIMLKSKIIVAFSIFGGIWAMKHYGIIGVATVTVTASFLKNVYIYLKARKTEDIVYKFAEYRNFLLIGVILSAFFILWIKLLNSPLYFFIGSFLFAVFSLILFINLHPFEKNEIDMLERLTQSNKMLCSIKKIIEKIYIKNTSINFRNV